MDRPAYTKQEMMAISAGRLIRNGDILFAGTGIAMLAATVAKRIHAPDAVVFFETRSIDPSLMELPLAVADPRVMHGACLNSGLIEAFSIVANRRLHTVAFLGRPRSIASATSIRPASAPMNAQKSVSPEAAAPVMRDLSPLP